MVATAAAAAVTASVLVMITMTSVMAALLKMPTMTGRSSNRLTKQHTYKYRRTHVDVIDAKIKCVAYSARALLVCVCCVSLAIVVPWYMSPLTMHCIAQTANVKRKMIGGNWAGEKKKNNNHYLSPTVTIAMIIECVCSVCVCVCEHNTSRATKAKSNMLLCDALSAWYQYRWLFRRSFFFWHCCCIHIHPSIDEIRSLYFCWHRRVSATICSFVRLATVYFFFHFIHLIHKFSFSRSIDLVLTMQHVHSAFCASCVANGVPVPGAVGIYEYALHKQVYVTCNMHNVHERPIRYA